MRLRCRASRGQPGNNLNMRRGNEVPHTIPPTTPSSVSCNKKVINTRRMAHARSLHLITYNCFSQKKKLVTNTELKLVMMKCSPLCLEGSVLKSARGSERHPKDETTQGRGRRGTACTARSPHGLVFTVGFPWWVHSTSFKILSTSPCLKIVIIKHCNKQSSHITSFESL